MIDDKSLVYSEVFEILRHVDKEKVMQIPEEIIKKIKANVSLEYKEKIDWSKKLSSQNFRQDTINIIGFLYYNYWCDTDKKKREYRQIVYRNRYNSLTSDKSNKTIK